MEQRKAAFWLSALLGFVVPGLIFRLGLAMLPDKVPAPAQTSPTAAETDGPKPTGGTDPGEAEKRPRTVPVLLKDGTVVEMELEEYLLGVVAAEVPASFAPEALKAQAVVARTFTLRTHKNGFKHPKGAVCVDSACCQAYLSPEEYLSRGERAEDLEKIRSAVQDTAGQILTYRGELIEATYFSCSGGKTEDAVAVWGSEIPYLQSVESPGEETAEAYREQVYFSAKELEDKLGRNLEGRPEDWIGQISHTEGGGVASLVLGGISYTGVELRRLLGLRSTAFTLEPDAEGILITTLGYGHRVGMSQYGAEAMAQEGKTYRDILFYYYQGINIDKIENIL